MGFKVGDRVAVYRNDRFIGKVVSIEKFGQLNIALDGDIATGFKYIHPKQCRLLKKKERRRVWINPNPTPEGNVWIKKPKNNFVTYDESPTERALGWIEFIEVKKK